MNKRRKSRIVLEFPSTSNRTEPLNQVEALERIHPGNGEGTENGQGAVNDAPDKRQKAADFDVMNIFRARNKSRFCATLHP